MQQPQQSSPTSSPTNSKGRRGTAKNGGVMYGMFRKTKRKTYSALRGGGRRHHHRRRHPNAILEDGDADDDDDDLSNSSIEEEVRDVAMNGGQFNNMNGSSPGAFRHPRLFGTPTPRISGGNNGDVNAIEPSRSFYFSPLNSWRDNNQIGNPVGLLQQPTLQQQHPTRDNKNSTIESSVHIVERIVRQIVICCTMFIAGTCMSNHANLAYHVLELSLVAWGTCLLIVFLGWFQQKRLLNQQQQSQYQQQLPAEVANNTGQLTPRFERLGSRGNRSSSLTSNKRSRDELLIEEEEKQPPSLPFDESAVGDRLQPPSKIIRDTQRQQPTSAITIPTKPPKKEVSQQHPHLENLYVMLVGQQTRIFPNSIEYDVDNDLFYGKMLLMFRTPDVDEPSSSLFQSPSSSNDINDNHHQSVVKYFRGKQRRFEFQWQLRLKKLPEGELFLGAEVEEPIQMGMIQRAVAGAALKFVKKLNQGFSYYFSDTPDTSSFLSFPVGTSMDRFSATKVGDPLPILGQEIVEDPETIKQRKKGMKIEWRTDEVYTMALWSAYVDWIDWKFLNFPGIRPFSATSVVGVQAIMLNLYTQSSDAIEKNVLFSIEMSNASKSTLGNEAKKWIAENAAEDNVHHHQQQISVATRAAESSAEEMGSIDGDGESLGDNAEEVTYEEDFGEEPSIDDDDDDDLMEEEEEEEVLELDNPETSCYLLSGTSIYLKEGTGSYVASGGGYAVIQSSPTSSVILEKNQPKRKKGSYSYSSLIRSGDIVRVKLVDVATKTVKWLVIHRGWWLKWSSTRPKRNGLFCIRTDEANGSLVLLGQPFSLVSRRWSQYTIGACCESSFKYGGRMLGIYKTGRKPSDDAAVDMDDNDDAPIQQDSVHDGKDSFTTERIMPLFLCAEAYDSVNLSSPAKSPTRASKLAMQLNENDLAVPKQITTENELQKRYDVDVPVWLDIMNREKRTKQLVYAVRIKETTVQIVKSNESDQQDEYEEFEKSMVTTKTSTTRYFVKLRTGRELAPILRLGAGADSFSPGQSRFDFHNQDELSDDADSFSSSSDDSSGSEEELEEDDDDDQSHFLIAGPNHNDSSAIIFPDDEEEEEIQPITIVENDVLTDSAVDEEGCVISRKGKGHVNVKRSSSKFKRTKSADDLENLLDRQETSMSTNSKERTQDSEVKKRSKAKHSAVIGRVAKTVKSSTVITGKHVIKHSKNIGKGTMKGTVSAVGAAGRVLPVSSVVNYKPPRRHEPGGRVHRKRSDKSQMKMIGRALKNIEGQGNFSTSLLAGQLLASDQSCRQVSKILSSISNGTSLGSQDAMTMLASTTSTLDVSFLRGGSAELGIKPLIPVDPKADVDCVVARCIYEGKWREEYCVLYTNDQHLAFYAPLAKKPSLAVSFDEIISARVLCDEDTSSCPLPGLYTMAIDTAWKCHYMTFVEIKERDNFLKQLNDALFHMNESHQPPHKIAQEFESYRMSLETSLTGTVGKWRKLSASKKTKDKKQRRVLNGRKMSFDVISVSDKKDTDKKNAQKKFALFVENLLRMALSFSPDGLDASDSRFIEFLDETSRLRTMNLHDIDLASKESLCIVVNLYHCLLQHALLLAVDGLPNKRSVTPFKRCSCYEIGEDVFSLSELECCIIRGKMSRPSHIKPPFVDAPKKSRPYRMIYGIGATDYRINFILNNGDTSYPSGVPVLQQHIMDDQIDVAASLFLMNQVKIDKRKRTVFLPKVCDTYRNDFGMGDGIVCLSQCLRYLDESSQLAIGGLLEGGVVSVKFERASENFHSALEYHDPLNIM